MIDDSQGGFSIHDWMHQKSDAHRNGFLYLHCKPKHRASLKPLLTAWISTAIQALMDLEPDAKRRVWFIVDELASLHKLPALGTALAEARKYGGCFVLGVQDLSQLEDTYGVAASRFLSELCVSKVFFQTVDATNAKRLSYMLGEREVLESNENISFGANEIRDGVSLSHHKKMKPVVGMSDIMGLSPLQSYLKIADVTAVLFYQFCYAHLVSKNPLYVEKDIPKTVKAETQNTEEKPPSPLHDHMEKILTDVKETNHDKENTNTRSRMGRKDSSPPVSRE
jgi:type IV secretory pathway TraG/TraD family ATPase VirD4